MTQRRPRTQFLGAIGAFAAVEAPGLRGSAADESYTLRMGIADPATSVPGVVALRFAAAVNRRTNGRLKIEVYPSGQLAQQQASIDGLASGSLDLSIQAPSFLATLVPRFEALYLPFLFPNLPVAFRALDGPIGADLFAELETKGILGLGWGTGGFRQLFTVSKAVTAPEDLKGLRIRLAGGAVGAATLQALGAIPLTIDMTELFVAFSQHTADGIDINLDFIANGKFYTVIKHAATLNHALATNLLLGSKRKIEALPTALQRVLKEEGKNVVPFWRAEIVRQASENTELLQKNGIAFTQPALPPFRKAMDPVYAASRAKIGGDIIDRFTRAASSG